MEGRRIAPPARKLLSSASAPSTSSLGPPRSETRFKDRSLKTVLVDFVPSMKVARFKRHKLARALSVLLKAAPLDRRCRTELCAPGEPQRPRRLHSHSGNRLLPRSTLRLAPYVFGMCWLRQRVRPKALQSALLFAGAQAPVLVLPSLTLQAFPACR